MGIVIVGSLGGISVFSIERNERFRYIDVASELPPHAAPVSSGHAVHRADSEVTTSSIPLVDKLWECNSDCVIKNISASDFGSIIAYLEVVPVVDDHNSSQDPDRNTTPMKNNHDQRESRPSLYAIVSYSVSGTKTGFLEMSSRVTCLNCPGRSYIVTVGTEDGAVFFLHCTTLDILFSFRPNENCVRLTSSGEVMAATPRQNSDKQRKSASGDALQVHGIPASAIVRIRVGPKLDRPILAAISNSSGHIYLMAFPDFVKFERTNSTSTLAQIVNAPIQAVKGTLQQAQNLTMLAGDAAGSFAQNAKGIADDALGEAQNFLKKVFHSVDAWRIICVTTVLVCLPFLYSYHYYSEMK